MLKRENYLKQTQEFTRLSFPPSRPKHCCAREKCTGIRAHSLTFKTFIAMGLASPSTWMQGIRAASFPNLARDWERAAVQRHPDTEKHNSIHRETTMSFIQPWDSSDLPGGRPRSLHPPHLGHCQMTDSRHVLWHGPRWDQASVPLTGINKTTMCNMQFNRQAH